MTPPPTTRETIHADLEWRIAQSSFPEPFALRNLTVMESWTGPIDVRIRAKILVSLIASEPTAKVVDALSDAISALDDWRSVLSEFLRNAFITPQVIAAASRVAQRRGLTIPWAGLAATPRCAVAVYDALEQDGVIRFTQPSPPVQPGPCLIIGIEHPLEHHGEGLLSLDGDMQTLTVSDATWMERGRLVCPAFAVVVR